MRDLIKLVSTAGTGTFYTTTRNKKPAPGKNKKLGTEKLQLIKFDRRAKNEKTGRSGPMSCLKKKRSNNTSSSQESKRLT